MSARWWVSWYESGGDYRPLIWPLPPQVPKFWCSGWRGSDATLCAVVDAATEEEAKMEIVVAWGTGNKEWRFVEPMKPGEMPPADRFPP